jgi:hypothetical protein
MPLQAWRSELEASDPDVPPQPSLPLQLFWLTPGLGDDAHPTAGVMAPTPAIIPAIAALTNTLLTFEFILSPFFVSSDPSVFESH